MEKHQDAVETTFTRSHLWKPILGDVAAAAISATLITPVITVIDQSMVEKVSFNRPLSQGMQHNSLDALKHPGPFVFGRPFGYVWILYAATYAVSNSSDTLAREFHKAAVGTITFVNTMIINVPLGVLKDVRFAQMFSASPTLTPRVAPVAKPGVPRAATATFLMRDAITIFGSFTMAPWLSSLIPDSLSSSAHSKAVISQLTVPIFSQFFATPVHLLGLDLYSRPRGIPWIERSAQIRRDLFSATILRSLRIIPAFGVGASFWKGPLA
ncbi:hypothetical protein FLAG1_07936 [Fusarium langsethiae]|uniref:Sequence orphan n=1 Tax=Fusarium langsethiae TaxID=179993 RepID=A0A0N0DD60_FUSLA|nr:hypothetical protein FLAG1_07936 [Fusarium langsethiae]GKU05541.1 unnamed protein product [Fusarium langsethiae]GKU20024.1 unnamed protein product [Fusarium langsethiae]